jgi:RNA:NAD 2'-phosphotransferase (TPT1/KptA family)
VLALAIAAHRHHPQTLGLTLHLQGFARLYRLNPSPVQAGHTVRCQGTLLLLF